MKKKTAEKLAVVYVILYPLLITVLVALLAVSVMMLVQYTYAIYIVEDSEELFEDGLLYKTVATFIIVYVSSMVLFVLYHFMKDIDNQIERKEETE